MAGSERLNGIVPGTERLWSSNIPNYRNYPDHPNRYIPFGHSNNAGGTANPGKTAARSGEAWFECT